VRHRQWLQSISFEHAALNATLRDYVTETDHQSERIAQFDKAIDVAVEQAPETMRQVIAALQTLRGVAKLTAATIVAEVGQLSRFAHPRQLMSYTGLVSSEDSSGDRTRRGAITKSGNAHLRRIVVETAWSYRSKPYLYPTLRKRQTGQSEPVKAIAWRAQNRLHDRYWRLASKGKPLPKVTTAVARELLGFIWAIGRQVEADHLSAGSRRATAS
jgi:transposase